MEKAGRILLTMFTNLKLYRLRFLLIFFLLVSMNTTAQFYIGNGAQVQLTGNTQLTLQDIDFINNGSFSPGNSSVLFSGNTDAAINGSQPIQFYTIQVEKFGSHKISLGRAIGISNSLDFINGFLDLNSHNIDLGSTGLLIGETEYSRITGSAGGEVIFNATLNAPAGANPGNLGAVISSSENLGNTVIKRGHQPKSMINGNSIFRYYDIAPTNNSALDATLRFSYFDAELDTLTESTLVQWKSPDGINWIEQGATINDISANYVEKSGIDALFLTTLYGPFGTVPVIFVSFNLQCNDNGVLLQWKTAQEINSSHFNVERNSGSGWINIGTVPAGGTSTTERRYVFSDPNPSTMAYYRIAQYDAGGEVYYTPIVRENCNAMADVLQVWPNPFTQSFSLQIKVSQQNNARIRVVNALGAEFINRSLTLAPGQNQFEFVMQKAAAGIYMVTVEWDNGQQSKTITLLKK